MKLFNDTIKITVLPSNEVATLLAQLAAANEDAERMATAINETHDGSHCVIGCVLCDALVAHAARVGGGG